MADRRRASRDEARTRRDKMCRCCFFGSNPRNRARRKRNKSRRRLDRTLAQYEYDLWEEGGA